MAKEDPIGLTADQLAKNPAIDINVVNDARRVREQLEELGMWEEGGSRVRSPFDIRPGSRLHGQRLQRLTSQDW